MDMNNNHMLAAVAELVNGRSSSPEMPQWDTSSYDWMRRSPNVENRSGVDGWEMLQDANTRYYMNEVGKDGWGEYKRGNLPPVTPLGQELGIDNLVNALVNARKRR